MTDKEKGFGLTYGSVRHLGMQGYCHFIQCSVTGSTRNGGGGKGVEVG